MGDRPVPYRWEGRQVVARLLEAGEYTVGASLLPLEAQERTGTLQKVTELVDILVSLITEPNGIAVSTFYPWSAILHLRPQDKPTIPSSLGYSRR